jgi:hypothetical protein
MNQGKKEGWASIVSEIKNRFMYIFIVWIKPSAFKYNTGRSNLRLLPNYTSFVIFQNGASLVKVSNSSVNG